MTQPSGSGPSSGDVALACAGLFVDELVRAGVEHACIAPGSRSTPLALALARHPEITLHVHLDERSAGFFALGAAKASGRAAVVACTSGTAAANLLPAVVEASHARVPIIVLTADRPPELRDTGANQTIDQIKLYGSFVRWFSEAALPTEGSGRYWRSLGAHTAAAATGPPAGPAHVNLPFREPLQPSGGTVDLGPDADGRAAGRPWQTVTPATLDVDDISELAAMVHAAERGVVVAASPVGDAALQLAERSGWPLIAEPASGARQPPWALGAAQSLLACGFVERHRPEVVMQLGGPTTSRATAALLDAAQTLIVVDPHLPPSDPSRHASWTVRADPARLAERLVTALAARSQTPWLTAWRDADTVARTTIDELLDSWTEPFEGRVARDLAAGLPDASTLVVASSMPIRDLDTFMAPRTGLRVLANRGASGIDGFVSTVLGVGATLPGPVYALTGDLSLLHDASGLVWSGRRDGVSPDAVFVVLNNDGGAVFSFLPQVSLAEHEALFATPHGLDLSAVAAAAGAGHLLVDRADALIPAIEKATAAGGIWIVEVPTDRIRNVELHQLVNDAVRSALTAKHLLR